MRGWDELVIEVGEIDCAVLDRKEEGSTMLSKPQRWQAVTLITFILFRWCDCGPFVEVVSAQCQMAAQSPWRALYCAKVVCRSRNTHTPTSYSYEHVAA